jgi:Sulfotransferase family
MISHKLRCIFIHIPRTGGSSVEDWLVGRDWWFIEPATKHLTARQSRALYAPWWDSYFKFAVVRHPLTRAVSTFHIANYFNLNLRRDGSIDFDGYKRVFGSPVTVEYDYRFARAEEVRHEGHEPGQIYGNILDCDLDFIARYETLAEDMDHVRKSLGLRRQFGRQTRPLRMKSTGAKPDAMNPRTMAAVQALYDKDYARYGYARDADPAAFWMGNLPILF